MYAAVGLTLIRTLGEDLAGSSAALANAVERAGAGWYEPVIRLGAAAASLGALLALMAGIGRTALAMAREQDLPARLASVSPRHQVPDAAQLALGGIVAALVLLGDLRGAIGFSSFGVLIYYAIANLSALRQPAAQRRSPRTLNLIGLLGCLTLVATLPARSIGAGLLVFAIGLGGRAVVRRTAYGRRRLGRGSPGGPSGQ